LERNVTISPNKPTNREIAVRLGLAKKSIDTHRLRLQARLGLERRADIARYAIEAGILSASGGG
jgi:DNA-binding CsgD family transcriptional regulator